MDQIVSTTTENVLKCGVEVIKRHVGYLCYYNDKVQALISYVEKLKDARMRVQHRVEDAKRNAEEIEADVQHWLEEVGKEIKKCTEFLGDGGHAKTRCWIGFFPNNLQLRYRLGRKATKMAEKNQLVNQTFDRVSYRPGPSMEAPLSNIGYERFVSRERTMKRIMEALGDSTVRMIGIYGAGGVGKTTLVKEVAKKARENKLINIVAMANITRNPNIKKIQWQIAELLGMKLEDESEIVRAGHLRKRLKKETGNTLIILDDLWDGLDLNKLGIPCDDDDDDDDDDDNDYDDDGSQRVVKDVADFSHKKMKTEKSSGDYDDDDSQRVVKDVADFSHKKMKKEKSSGDYRGCKIFLTSRRKEVLCGQMNVEENSTFFVGILEEKEAETLLKKVAGIDDKNSHFEEMSVEIAKMCAGFPMAIVSIGRVLKNKSSFFWEDVCRRQTFMGGESTIEFSIQLSYDHLKNEELKSIFLLCARMGNDPLIMDLVKYCIGLGMLQGVCTIREARDRVNVLIEELIDSSLLVESYSTDRFNMHGIVRDVALSIASKEKHVFTMKNGKLDEWPRKDKLERCAAISLHYCDIIDELPESISCPRLEVFHVDSKDPFLKIPDNFFKEMRELRVLILTGVHLSCLPSSIKYLTNLRMLCLERCTLGENLSIIGELKKLRILSFSGSSTENLPVELGQLGKLQLFDLSNCLKLKVIPSNIISRLISLEELYMRDNLILWETEKQGNQSENASLSELRHLNQLTTLDIHIPNVAHLPWNLFFDKLDSYKIVFGEFNMLSGGDFKMHDKYEAQKVLALQLKDGGDIHFERGIKMILKRVENLLLGELNGVHDVLYELNFEGFPELKHLSIVNNFGVEHIINSRKQSHPLEAFPKLESMCLYKLESMEKICNNQLTDASFRRLKIIKIKGCDQLQNLFSFYMVTLLTELQTIEVCDCGSLKEIVCIGRQLNAKNEGKDDHIEFPQLRFLTLQSLPAFTCFYTNDKVSSISQSYEDQVQNKEPREVTTEAEQGANACFSLFNQKVSIPKLECLDLSSINIRKIWSEQSLLSHSFPNFLSFQNLLSLNVANCGNLNYLLSFSMAESLVNLQSLTVSGCDLMEDIFSTEDARQIDVLPKLKKIGITRMEKLKTIWHPHIGLHSFHSLDSLAIEECHKLVGVFPSYTRKIFQSLQTLQVINCKSVENVFDLRDHTPQTDGRNETNLSNVTIKELPNLLHIRKEDTPTQGIHNVNNLQHIFVYGCHNLENLFPLFVASGLKKLEHLEVYDCYGMKEIVARDEGSNENTLTFEFPLLNFVSLQRLYELRSFYRGTHTIEWPSLKQLWLCSCDNLEALTIETTNSKLKPIFLATEKVISNLESMAMSLKEAKWLQDCIGNAYRMHKLKSLVLNGLKDTKVLFWFLNRIANLESLKFFNCCFKEVWAPESLIAHEKIGNVVQLKELVLQNSLFLQRIGFEHDPLLQRVERLVIDNCPSLINLAPSSVSFSHLTYLEARKCNGLKNLMASSTAKGLFQLTTMKVFHCKMITEIIAENINEEEKLEEIVFRQLKALELVSRQSLTSFCGSKNCDLNFPLLEKLVVSECPRMKKFCEGVKSAPNLPQVHVTKEDEEHKWYWEGDLNTTIQKNFVDKVRSCRAVEVIFDVNDTEIKKTKGIVFRLKKLALHRLPNLKRLWNKNPQGIDVSFPNLQEVVVKFCRNLRTLLPASLARNLVKLKILQIHNCIALEEIVGKEDAAAHGSNDNFVFKIPRLTCLILYRLPRLNCFYPGIHNLECPNLKILRVLFCDKLKIFISEFQSHQEVLPERQPLFSVQKVIPNLTELSLNKKNIIMLSDVHFPPDLLHKLNHLRLSFDDGNEAATMCFGLLHRIIGLSVDCVNEAATLPFGFLHKVPNLDYLRVQQSTGLEEIFPSQKLQVHNEIFAQLKELYLYELPDLNSIGLEHTWVKPHSEKLERLTVSSCPRLIKLVRCAVSFSNLKALIVQRCKGLNHLFTYSTAKSLVQLESITVRECQSIEAIVSKGDESASDEIILGRLRTLFLKSLPRLVCFYSGKATLQLSHLEKPRVCQCPKMETFSRGLINAPRFWVLQASMDDETDIFFHDNLNTTVQKLLQEKVACTIQYLNFGDHPELQEIWLGVVPILTDSCFNNLKSLIVVECESLSNVIPYYLLPFLKNLEEMEVSNCGSVKAIFDVQDIRGDRQMRDIEPAGSLFSIPLKKLTLKQLPNLEHIWNMNPDGILSLQDLREVYIDSCRSLKTLLQTSIANHLVKLEVKYCEGLVEIVAEDEAASLKGATKQFVFQCLSSLTLCELPELKYFYPREHSLEWPVLKELHVYHCHKLKLFTTEHQSCGDTHVEDQLCI